MVLVPITQVADHWATIKGEDHSHDPHHPDDLSLFSAPTSRPRAPSSASSLPSPTAPSAAAPVHIFVAVGDCDAVATVATLTALLRADLIPYTVAPVASYTQLGERFRAVCGFASADAAAAAVQRPRAVLCVNCGARANMEEILFGEDEGAGLEDEEARAEVRAAIDAMRQKSPPVYVLDSQRPFHVGNIESTLVQLLNDSAKGIPHDVLPLRGFEDQYGYLDADSDEEEESDDDSAAEDGSESGSERSDAHGSDEDDEDDVVFRDNDCGQSPGRRKRQASGSPSQTRSRSKRRRKKSRREKLNLEKARKYYTETYRGLASAFVAHVLARDLNKGSIMSLWLAIVGATDQFLFQRVNSIMYSNQTDLIQDELLRLNPVGRPPRQDTDDQGTYDASKLIQATTELRLDMLRHWSLFESMTNSAYVCARIGSWKKVGRNRISEILAQLGIPRHEAEQKWTYMNDKCKVQLQDLQRVMEDFGLPDIQYDGFVKVRAGFKGQVSAADVVFAANAILELDSDERAERGVQDEDSKSNARFWHAYDLLSECHDSLHRGLELAMHVQKFLIQEAHEIMERERYIPSGTFRYVFLGDSQQKSTLSKPLVLVRLALLIMDALRAQRKKHKPFVILAPSATIKRWLAVAVSGLGEANSFGQKFRIAAAKTQANITVDTFDAAVAEIEDGSEKEFIRYLHDILG